MKTKIIEIRDRATCIPALVIRMEAGNEIQRYYFRCTGFGNFADVILMRLSDQFATCDSYRWGSASRTMGCAHRWLNLHWDDIEEGGVLDIEYILGETQAPKQSERI
jgi:hypothetical protein